MWGMNARLDQQWCGSTCCSSLWQWSRDNISRAAAPENLLLNIWPGFTASKLSALASVGPGGRLRPQRRWRAQKSGGIATTKGFFSRQTSGISFPLNHRNKEPNYFWLHLRHQDDAIKGNYLVQIHWLTVLLHNWNTSKFSVQMGLGLWDNLTKRGGIAQLAAIMARKRYRCTEWKEKGKQ